MIGASQRGDRDSHRVMRYLQQQGYRVIPVNPTLGEGATILGEPVHAKLQDVQSNYQMIDVFRRPDAVAGIVDEILALERRPAYLWLQLGVVDSDAAKKARNAGITVVMDRCIKIEHGRLGR
ncbi:MAG: CoA-binding protein [Woeseia sp.]|nr:CoA-binding protein [Woeseia sp.]NNE60934.1 CoA-binding protein [Woeseia sp.]NNL56054.1 CoA-binding protein [Woeseia sp.]